jgi:hypothetical protein
MGASDTSVITSLLVSGGKTQFRRPLPGDCGGYFSTQTRGLAPQSQDGIRYRKTSRDKHVHQKVPAIRRRKNILDEQAVNAIANIPLSHRKVERSLNLPAKLPCLSLCLTAGRRIPGPVFMQCVSELWIYER